MRDLNEELDRLQQAAAAVRDYPGAAAAGFGALKRLRRLYQR